LLDEHQSRAHNRIRSSSLVLFVLCVLQELDVLKDLDALEVLDVLQELKGL